MCLRRKKSKDLRELKLRSSIGSNLNSLSDGVS